MPLKIFGWLRLQFSLTCVLVPIGELSLSVQAKLETQFNNQQFRTEN